MDNLIRQSENHEERIQRLEKSGEEMKAQLSDLTSSVDSLTYDLREKYTRIEESNKFLRESHTALSQQNERLYSAVLDGNKQSAQRGDELKKQRQQDSTKLWVSIFGAGGGAIVIIKLIFDFMMATN